MEMTVLLLLGYFCGCLVNSWGATDRVVCYYSSWSVYRQDHCKYNINDTDTSLCTHIVYAFVSIAAEDGSLRVQSDGKTDRLKVIGTLMSLKDSNPNLKILVSMGGWSDGSVKYSNVAASVQKRALLISSVSDFIEEWGFDGFDLDWEYPSQRNGTSNDMENYVTMLSELKSALNTKGLLLTAAVVGSPESIDKSYDVAKVAAILDMVNVMSYNYHGTFNPYVGHCAPLYASHLDLTKAQKQKNVDAGIRHWIAKGADPQKLNMGLNLYGRTFTLDDVTNGSLYARAKGGGEPGPYTRSRGVLAYSEICELHNAVPRSWDDEQKVPHKQSGDQWCGYEDEESLTVKVEYAKNMDLGGVMVWSLDTDDFENLCGDGEFPLLTAINRALGNR